MEAVVAEGESIDAAIETALAMLGVTRDRVEIEILSNATRGILGFGGRKARVRATLRRPITEESEVRGAVGAVAAETLPDLQEAPATGVDASPSPVAEAAPRAPLHGGCAEAAVAPAPPRRERPAESVSIDGAMIEHAAQVLREIVTHIGVEAQVDARAEGDRVVLQMTGDTSGVLIGRRGQMLDALEYIVNRIVSRDEGASAHIVIDSENYRERRQAALEDLARRMADQAKKKRKPVTLNPMSPRDRRIVHLVLQSDRSLTTRSSGTGFYRKLVIIPEGVGRGTRGTA